MNTTLMVHIAAGGVGLIAGFTALYASKGAPLHRRAGVTFVYAMLGMCTAGVTLACRGAWNPLSTFRLGCSPVRWRSRPC